MILSSFEHPHLWLSFVTHSLNPNFIPLPATKLFPPFIFILDVPPLLIKPFFSYLASIYFYPLSLIQSKAPFFPFLSNIHTSFIFLFLSPPFFLALRPYSQKKTPIFTLLFSLFSLTSFAFLTKYFLQLSTTQAHFFFPLFHPCSLLLPTQHQLHPAYSPFFLLNTVGYIIKSNSGDLIIC